MVVPSSSSGGGRGVYEVQEDGLKWKHNVQQEQQPPGTPQEFLDHFHQNFELRVLERPSPDTLILEFDHVDVSFVNALRRILLSEIPTVAIETVYMWNNTSLIHDEVLAHRLGLIPIHFDARRLMGFEESDGSGQAAGSPTDRNTIVFRLHIGCDQEDVKEDLRQKQERKRNNQKSAAAPTKKTAVRGGDDDNNNDDEDSEEEAVVVGKGTQLDVEQAVAQAARAKQQAAKVKDMNVPKRPYTKHVYSGDMEWLPQNDQADRFKNAGVRPVHDDILIAKLRPGQEIELEAHARKGIGKDHAKYSPVATASYRLYTEIELLEPVYDELAEELVHIYEPGVFELVPSDEPGTRVKAKVCNSYACTMSRNYMRNPQLAKAIRMVRIPDRFIFSIESVGIMSPAVLLGQALTVLQSKCLRVQEMADQAMAP